MKELTQVDAAARHRNVELAAAHHRPRIENEAQKALLQRLRRDRLDQEFVHAEPHRCGDARLQSHVGQHDDRQVRLGIDARRAHDAHDLAPVQDRHLPIHDHDVGVDRADGVKCADTVAGLIGRLDPEIGQHHSRQPACVGVAVRDQDNKTFHDFLEFLSNH